MSRKVINNIPNNMIDQDAHESKEAKGFTFILRKYTSNKGAPRFIFQGSSKVYFPRELQGLFSKASTSLSHVILLFTMNNEYPMLFISPPPPPPPPPPPVLFTMNIVKQCVYCACTSRIMMPLAKLGNIILCYRSRDRHAYVTHCLLTMYTY